MVLMVILTSVVSCQQPGCEYKPGKLIYENDFSSKDKLTNWILEGPGKLEFKDNWMQMYSPGEEFHHVFWYSEDLPASFIAEWEMQNMHPEAGLCIVFFAARGTHGEDIFDSSLPERDGDFKLYTRDQINSYHISFYANNPNNKERETSHLRKNNMFEIVQEGEEGIPKNSTDIHQLRLIKNGPKIIMYIDNTIIIDWTDDGKSLGPVYAEGKFGFRQMKWSHFRYRNLRVWEIK